MFFSIISTLSAIFKFPFLRLFASFESSYPPPLSKEEEEKLFLLLKKGDAAARDKLILHNMRLVAHIVKKHYLSAENQEDLISIGTIGLIKAIDTFDITNGARFATYASRCLQNEILMHFRAQKKQSLEVSINDAIDTDKDGNPLTYMDIIAVDDTIADDLDKKMRIAKAMEALKAKLSERERTIIILRYGLCDRKPLTQKEVAKRLCISRSYVSRIEKTALSVLAQSLT
ncbi:MAG: RNA polymerase sporulation sigma factor SigK [Clostridia bacterium]|nr:RNA polymerase sporulation sigma factor SigK [Clostridia bacterium]